jgi:hypothetical protein
VLEIPLVISGPAQRRTDRNMGRTTGLSMSRPVVPPAAPKSQASKPQPPPLLKPAPHARCFFPPRRHPTHSLLPPPVLLFPTRIHPIPPPESPRSTTAASHSLSRCAPAPLLPPSPPRGIFSRGFLAAAPQSNHFSLSLPPSARACVRVSQEDRGGRAGPGA